MTKCKYCGKEFIPKTSQNYYCNPECYKKANMLRLKKRKEEERKEIQAEKKFLREQKKIREKRMNLRRKPKISIEKVVKNAKLECVTYGMWVAEHQ